MNKQLRKNCESIFSDYVKKFSENGFIPTFIVFQSEAGAMKIQPFGNVTTEHTRIVFTEIARALNDPDGFLRMPMPDMQ